VYSVQNTGLVQSTEYRIYKIGSAYRIQDSFSIQDTGYRIGSAYRIQDKG